MATATVTTTYPLPPPPPAPIKLVSLTLTEAEAQTLVDICALIGGDPHKSRRTHADAIASALSEVGFIEPFPIPDVEPHAKSIYFTEVL